MSAIYPEQRVYTLEHILHDNGDHRYRFSQRQVADPWVTRSTILVCRTDDGIKAHMMVAHHRPGNTKHGLRVDEDISIEIARHIVGNWAGLANNPDPIPFPEF